MNSPIPPNASNRTDFIRTAIRNRATSHAGEVRQTVARKRLVLGLERHTRRVLAGLARPARTRG